MAKNKKIEVLNTDVSVQTNQQEDYISLTDIARYKDSERTDYIIMNWMRNRNTIEFLGIWEQLNNPAFNPIEFDGIRKQAGLNSFILTAKRWIDSTGVLGDIANISSGGTPSRSNPAYWNGNIPWVKTTQIQNCIINKTDVDEWITDEGLKKSSAKMISAGTILMAMYGQEKTRGQVSILNFDASINQACAAIADLLSIWDEAIEKTERLIQAKEKRFKWLLRELISEPRNTQKDAKWKRVNIGAFLTESRISGTNGRDAQKITVKLYGKGVIAKDEKRIGSETTQYYVRKSGQFIYSKLDFLNGAFGIIPEELDGFESTLDLPAFDIADSVSKEWFLYYLIRPEYYTRQLGLAKGQRKARRVNPSEFLKSKIPFPPFEVQKQIAETLSSAQHEIDLLKQLSEKYKTQKRGLMQKMLTGEWRVKPEIVNQYMEA
jgi:type I restriction enzyme, S subunit